MFLCVWFGVCVFECFRSVGISSGSVSIVMIVGYFAFLILYGRLLVCPCPFTL